MKNETRPTPETDAHQDDMHRFEFDEELALTYEFARKLERERDAMLEAIRESVSELQKSRFVHPSLSAAITKIKPFFP